MTIKNTPKISMTPEEFKNEYQKKGWTQSMIAERWGYSSSRDIRAIQTKIERTPHFADAVMNLPYIIKITG